MTYYVPAGNWTNDVVNSLGDNSTSVLPFEINFDSTPDPAKGCQKDFTANYNCGANTAVKSLRIPKSADGQTATFDCSTEATRCDDLKFTLTDDGKLTLTNTAGTTIFWDSVTAFGANGSIPANTIIKANTPNSFPDNAPLTIPDFAGNGQPNAKVDVGPGGGPGRRYIHNYLLPGQFLEFGQWIGSPSGTCRLMMGTPEAPNSLQVVKTILGCSSLDAAIVKAPVSSVNDLGCWKDTENRALSNFVGSVSSVDQCKKMAIDRGATVFGLQNRNECWLNKAGDDYQKYGQAPGSCPALGGPWVNHVYGTNSSNLDPNANLNSDLIASRVYTIPDVAGDIGKVGYVNSQGQLQLYPDSMTAYDTKYEKIGTYDIAGSALGAAFDTKDATTCQDSCTNVNGDTQKCAAFVFDTTTAMCQLLDNTMYGENRIINKNKQLYLRQKSVKNQDVSCPVDVTIQTAEFWSDNYRDDSPDMSPSTKCGLAYYTQAERAAVAGDVPPVYNNLEYKDEDGNLTDYTYDTVSQTKDLRNKNKNGFKYIFESLQDKYYKLTNQLFNTKDQINTSFAELLDSKKSLADWSGEQLQNLQAMNEDRDLNMMSQNYRHIMWSILAILIVIVTMKMTKAKAVA
jgi:hypothetical protein